MPHAQAARSLATIRSTLRSLAAGEIADDELVRLKLAAALREVSAADIGAVLAPCVGHEAVSIIGDADVIGAGLDAAGLEHERLGPLD